MKLSYNLDEYGGVFIGQYIDKKYGQGTAEQLEIKSKMLCKRKQFDYEQIAKEYKSKLDDL